MTEQVNLKLGEEYKEKLEEIAEKQNRSMTGQVRHWIDKVNSK